MKKMKSLPLIIMLLSGQAVASDYWADYLASRTKGSDLRDPATGISDDNILPNFSYAGYRFSNQPLPDSRSLGFQVFNVLDFGAIADDGLSDKAAFRQAINAAENHIDAGGAGAIIEFPTGTFRLNEVTDMAGLDMSNTNAGRGNRESYSIRLSRGNLIIRGAGPDSVLYMDMNLELLYPDKMWTTPYLIEFGYNYDNRDPHVLGGISQPVTSPTGDRFITTVASDHPRGSTRTITVADGSKLQAGQWILLTRFDNRRSSLEKAVAPYSLDPKWASINKGLRSQEYHQIEKVTGNQVTFNGVIHHELQADGYWGLQKTTLIENVGVENLTFQGNWHEDFKHHKSGVHDGGWSAIRMSRVANAWVRNVHFKDVNQGLTLAGSAASTIKEVQFSGNPGHMSLDINASSHILAESIQDTARHWHAAGFSHRATGNVLTSSEHAPDRFHNLHADMPYANLIDNNTGGWNYGFMGGAVASQPNHLKYLVFWNSTNTASANSISDWSFMRHDSDYGRVIMPYVVGLQGETFNSIESQQTYDASLPDTPQAYVQATTDINSLYDSQLVHRKCSKVVSEPGLIGKWNLSGSVCDTSGLSNHAISYSQLPGTFDGINERVELGDFDTISRLEFDIKYDRWNANKAGFVISKSDYGTGNPYYVQISKTGVLSARVNGAGINAGNFGDGKWHKVLMTLNGTMLRLSIDGVEVGTKTVTLPASNNIPLSVGSTPKNAYPFVGEVANIKLYQ